MPDDLNELSRAIRAYATGLGFDLVGIAPAEPSKYRQYFKQWLDDGHAGSMQYLANRFEERTDPAVYLPGAKSVICVAMNYHAPLSAPPDEAPRGRIARYALGDDYHDVLKPRLHQLADWLRTQFPQAQTRCAVDTAPIMEKELAARAGIGWLAKNTCIVNSKIGSWLVLGEVLTTLALAPDEAAIDRCGTCTRCIDACPTQAITAPYQLDATRCISYLTIEHRGTIAADLADKLDDWVYGCDVCQDVCPWNHRAPWTNEPAFQPRFASGSISLDELDQWTPDDYQRKLKGSAMKRVKLPVLQRNAGHTRAAQAKAHG